MTHRDFGRDSELQARMADFTRDDTPGDNKVIGELDARNNGTHLDTDQGEDLGAPRSARQPG